MHRRSKIFLVVFVVLVTNANCVWTKIKYRLSNQTCSPTYLPPFFFLGGGGEWPFQGQTEQFLFMVNQRTIPFILRFLYMPLPYVSTVLQHLMITERFGIRSPYTFYEVQKFWITFVTFALDMCIKKRSTSVPFSAVYHFKICLLNI